MKRLWFGVQRKKLARFLFWPLVVAQYYYKGEIFFKISFKKNFHSFVAHCTLCGLYDRLALCNWLLQDVIETIDIDRLLMHL